MMKFITMVFVMSSLFSSGVVIILNGPSSVGHARSHYDTVHNGMTYDLEIETEHSTPDECAKQILTYITKAAH